MGPARPVERPAVADVPLERLIARLPTAARQVVSVFRFEFRRTRTVSRSFVWGMLVLFPVLIMGVARYRGGGLEEEVWGIVLYGLIPQVVCLLGLLLWVAPLLNTELEGRTWIYLAVRPHGTTCMLLGKYFNGVLWASTAALCGLILAIVVGDPPLDRTHLFFVLAMLSLGSCIGYGSVYALIGVLFPRRAMVFAVAYTLIFEVLLSNLPALINQLTIQYRLFNMLLQAMNWRFDTVSSFEVSERPVLFHLGVLAALVVINLTVAALALRFREYATLEEH